MKSAESDGCICMCKCSVQSNEMRLDIVPAGRDGFAKKMKVAE